MRTSLFALMLLALAASEAHADFAEGQRRFAVGDHAGAYSEWLPLAEAGEAKAQYSLGIMHQKGLGRPKDPEGAASWFDRAARQGYVPATTALKAMNRPAPGSWAKGSTERDRVERAVRAMFTEPDGRPLTTAFRVTESGGGFEILVEAFDVAGDAEPTLRMPQLKARATRAAADAWRFEFDTPREVKGGNEPGKPYRVRISEGRTVLVWSEALEMTTDADIDWRRMIFEGADGAPLNIARLTARSRLALEGAGRWSGPCELRVEGLELSEPGKAQIRLAGLYVRAAFAGADLPALARLARGGQGAAALDSLASLGRLISDASMEIGVEGLDAAHPDGRFRLNDGSWRLAVAKLDQPQFDLSVSYRHGGLSDERKDPMAALAPQEAQLKLALVRAPLEALLQAGVAAGVEYMLTGQVASAPTIAETLRKALPEARTQLLIEDGLLRMATAQLTLAGAFAADAQAALGVVGALGFAAVGLNELLAASPLSEKARPLLAEYGQTAPDGSTVFKLELGRDGAALVNGKPLAPLLAALLSD
jgi:hypothetical protein